MRIGIEAGNGDGESEGKIGFPIVEIQADRNETVFKILSPIFVKPSKGVRSESFLPHTSHLTPHQSSAAPSAPAESPNRFFSIFVVMLS